MNTNATTSAATNAPALDVTNLLVELIATQKRLIEVQEEATAAQFTNAQQDFEVLLGKQIIVRTVTQYTAGVLAYITPSTIVLSNAVWVGDTGNWKDFLSKGTASKAEVQPSAYPMHIMISSITDFCEMAVLPKTAG